jgi:hypothetical protein
MLDFSYKLNVFLNVYSTIMRRLNFGREVQLYIYFIHHEGNINIIGTNIIQKEETEKLEIGSKQKSYPALITVLQFTFLVFNNEQNSYLKMWVY